MDPLHRAFLAWQFWHACRTRRRGTEMEAPPLPSPEAGTTSTPTFSSYEQPKPSRSQLAQTGRRPSHRTLRARHVTHVLAVRFGGRGEVVIPEVLMCLTTIGRPSGIWRLSITGCRRRFGSNNSGSGSLSHVPLIRTRPCEAELSAAVCALLNGRVDLEYELL